MASSSKFPTPETVEDIFKNYSARRAAIIRALTDDFDRFYLLCDPAKEEAFCLFGHPNGLWEVAEPSKHVPPVLPEPVLGINYFRDELEHADWLSMIAIHSDCWLLSLAFFTSAKLLNRKERKRLFNLINDLPTIYEVVTGSKQDNPTIDSRSKCRSSSKRSNDALTRSNSKLLEESNKEECSGCGHWKNLHLG